MWPLLHTGFDLVELAGLDRAPASPTLAGVQWALFDALDLMWLWEAIGPLPRSDRWQTQARSAVRDDLLTTLAELTEACVINSPPTLHPETAVRDWLETNGRAVARVGAMLTEIRRAEHLRPDDAVGGPAPAAQPEPHEHRAVDAPHDRRPARRLDAYRDRGRAGSRADPRRWATLVA